MKKICVFVCSAAVLLASCGSPKMGKVVMETAVDSVSYTMGMSRSNGFLPYLVNQMGVDTAYIEDFIKGFIEGANMDADAGAQKAYFAGIQIGQQELNEAFVGLSANMFGKDSGKLMNKTNYMNGFLDGVQESTEIMTREQADIITDSLFNIFYAESMEEQYGENRDAGREYLANKAKEDGIVATGSGLLYRVIKEGKGAKPTATDNVRVNYRGSLIDGTVFDESTKPITLSLSSVIEGWTEALQLMNVGSKYELFIPYELGYGDSNNGIIKPYSALIFEVELVDIEK